MGRRAFTLIEMLVIIIIIAVMASIVVPSYDHLWLGSRFDMAVADIQDVFAYAREKAIENDTTTTVSFDSKNQNFIVQVTTLPPQTDLPVALQNAQDNNSQNANPAGTPRTFTIAENCQVHDFRSGGSSGPTTGGGTVHFRGDGSCDGAEFILDSDTGYRAHLVLMPAAGRLNREEP